MAHITPNIYPSSHTSPALKMENTDNVKAATTSPTKGGKRKGTRSVSTLTPSQLARKRANDREAQRAIRARTKEHIENLEKEIEELRSRHSRDQTVQDLLRRNKGLEEEVRRLRESLGIRSTGPTHHYEPSYGSSSQSSFGPATPADYHPIVTTDGLPYHSAPDTTDIWPSSVPCSATSTVSSPSSSGAAEEFGGTYLPTSMPPQAVLERASIPPGLSSPAASCISTDLSFDDVKSVSSRIWVPAGDGYRSHAPHVSSPSVQHVPNVLPSVADSNVSRRSSHSYWETRVSTISPLFRVDALIVGYIADCRRLMGVSGAHPHRGLASGPRKPNIGPLLCTYTEIAHTLGLEELRLQSAASHPVVDVSAAVFHETNLILPLERVGCFLLIRTLLSWLTQATREAYIELRDIFPPQSIQVSVPHSQWIDFIMWPRLRAVVIERQSLYDNMEFRQLYSTSLQLTNWGDGILGAFSVDFSTASVYPTDGFLEHVWDLRNWAMEENFMRRYPELVAYIGTTGV
ncbi:hypothetical protein F5Y16DRAFT_411622 [Xylariaceae sp. FL0255]|nr:hypothetical protein F5Y16DRAFT_411622 [Xylariaceae sp. FL0255]